jgi:hypothetical protein
MADWLVATGTKTVVMEPNGVYWVAAYEVLETHGLEVILANAREARAVPGRKSDVNDAQWLQRLHACGLLRASFRPGRDIAELRACLRAREKHSDYAAAHIQHMQKALTFMNIQLHHVIATITGVTGMRIIRAIVAGERHRSDAIQAAGSPSRFGLPLSPSGGATPHSARSTGALLHASARPKR